MRLVDSHRFQDILVHLIYATEHIVQSEGLQNASTDALRDLTEAELGKGGQPLHENWQADFATVLDKLVEEQWLHYDPQQDKHHPSDQWTVLLATESAAHPEDTDKRVIYRAVADQITKFGPRAARLSTLRKRTASTSPLPETPIARRTRFSELQEDGSTSRAVLKFALPRQKSRSRAKASPTKKRKTSQPVKESGENDASTSDSLQTVPDRAAIRALEKQIDNKIESLRRLESALEEASSQGLQDEIRSQIADFETELNLLHGDLKETVELRAAHPHAHSDADMADTSSIVESETIHASVKQNFTFGVPGRVASLTDIEMADEMHDGAQFEGDGPDQLSFIADHVFEESPTQAQTALTHKKRAEDMEGELEAPSETAAVSATRRPTSQQSARNETSGEATPETLLQARAHIALLRRELHAEQNTNGLFRAENERLAADHSAAIQQADKLQEALARAAAGAAADVEEERANFAAFELQMIRQADALVEARQEIEKLKEEKEREAQDMQQRMCNLEAEKEASQKRCGEALESVLSLETSLEAVKQERQELQDALHAAKAKYEDAAAWKTQVIELKESLEAAHAKSAALSAEVSVLRQEEEGLQSKMENLSAAEQISLVRLEKAEDEARQAAEALALEQAEHEKMRANLKTEYARALDMVSDKRNTLEVKCAELEGKISEREGALEALQAEVDQKRARIERLEEAHANLVDAHEEMSADLAQELDAKEQLRSMLSSMEEALQKFFREFSVKTSEARQKTVTTMRKARGRADDSGIGIEELMDFENMAE